MAVSSQVIVSQIVFRRTVWSGGNAGNKCNYTYYFLRQIETVIICLKTQSKAKNASLTMLKSQLMAISLCLSSILMFRKNDKKIKNHLCLSLQAHLLWKLNAKKLKSFVIMLQKKQDRFETWFKDYALWFSVWYFEVIESKYLTKLKKV